MEEKANNSYPLEANCLLYSYTNKLGILSHFSLNRKMK